MVEWHPRTDRWRSGKLVWKVDQVISRAVPCHRRYRAVSSHRLMETHSTRTLQSLAVSGILAFTIAQAIAEEAKLPPLPANAKLAFQEDWSSGRIDSKRWYVPRKKWGQGNNGVSPDNIRIGRDIPRGVRATRARTLKPGGTSKALPPE